ncbi:MAG TPA: hypothetical protein VEC57_01700 [Candidatus Limnocylindrales bacterium]|nr:hypothetical protein [Candidatus Limnocylindrales bacterium]
MDQALRTRLDKLAADCAATLGSRLRGVIVYGDAVWAAAAPTTVALLVDAVTMTLVRDVTAVAARWRRAFPPPLVLDDEYLATSCDVFPLELLALRDTHEVVAGDASRLEGLVLDLEHLRLEVEEQLKGKILHLRQAFIEARGRTRLLTQLLQDSSTGFETVMRGLLYLDGREHPRKPDEVLRAVQEATGVSLPAFERIQSARMHGGLRAAEADGLFERYHDELVELARAADRVTRG